MYLMTRLSLNMLNHDAKVVVDLDLKFGNQAERFRLWTVRG